MKKNDPSIQQDKLKNVDRTDWNRVIAQSESTIEARSKSDKDSPVLKNKKYTKPAKNS